MSEASTTLSELDRHSLFEACTREAKRIGGDERTAEYFFVRAQSSRVWLSGQGAVTVADMDIEDWCGAIAWSAPGVGRPPKRAQATSESDTTAANPARPRDTVPAPGHSSKQPRSGAKYRRSSDNPAND